MAMTISISMNLENYAPLYTFEPLNLSTFKIPLQKIKV